MMTVAYDINGKEYYAAKFKSSAEAHSRKYFDDCGIPVTPVISDLKNCHFRYIDDNKSGGNGNGMTLLHEIAQQRMQHCFNESNEFLVTCWERYNEPGDPKHLRSLQIDLKKYYSNANLEVVVNKRRADILLNPIDKELQPIFIEIAVSHECELTKIKEGHLIIEIRISKFEELAYFLKSGGIIESYMDRKKPRVRFWNFREKQKSLPWI